MEKIVYSKLKNCLISAQKVRLVADLIRKKDVASAESILSFTNKTAAKDVLKTLRSAIANSIHNDGWDKKDLVIAEIFVNDAPIYKRGRPAARGRYRAILKRNSHITIGLKNINEKKVEEVKKVEKIKEEVKVEKKEVKKTKINKKVIKK